MEPEQGGVMPRSIGAAVILSLALLFLAGCATSAASKQQGQPGAKGQGQIGTNKPQAALTPPSGLPTSSLEAQQKGILGKEAGTGPLKDVSFDFDRYELRADARAVLQVNANWLKANPSVSVQIEGHADERGTNEYNVALGAKRAESVKRYLIDLGIPAARLSTISYGEELPVCKEHNEECWAKNRRAHFATTAARTN